MMTETDSFYAVVEGRYDLGSGKQYALAGPFPAWDYGGLPFYWGTMVEYERASLDPRLIKLMEKSVLEDLGAVYLGDIQSGPIDYIWSNKPIVTIEDFKLLKTRVTGLLATYALEILGGAPLSMSFAEMTEAVRRGTVDAVHTSSGYGILNGLPDICEFATRWSFNSCAGSVQIANIDSWNDLSPDLQQQFRDVFNEFKEEDFYAAYVYWEYLMPQVMMPASGVTVVPSEPGEFEKAGEMILQPVIDKWLEIGGSLALEILAITDEYATGAIR